MGQILFDVELEGGMKVKVMDNGNVKIIEEKEIPLRDLGEEREIELVQKLAKKGITICT